MGGEGGERPDSPPLSLGRSCSGSVASLSPSLGASLHSLTETPPLHDEEVRWFSPPPLGGSAQGVERGDL